MKTKTEIIKETAKYYGTDPSRRAVEETKIAYQCSYYLENGNRCAVGRCMKNPDRSMIGAVDLFRVNGQRKSIEDYLMDKYKGHSVEFWGDLQALHDKKNHWNGDGLTSAGLEHLEKILEKWK